MVVASVLAHILAVAVFSGVFTPASKRPDRPVYYVDLVNLPVANPQAGRPDGRRKKTTQVPETKKPAVKARETVKLAPSKKPAVQKKAVKKKPVQKKVVTPKKEAPKAKVKPRAKPKTRSVEEKYEQSVVGAVEALRAKKKAAQAEQARKAKIAVLKNKLAAMASRDTRGGSGHAPLGEENGRGHEAGNPFGPWLQTYLTTNWSLSRYQVSRQDLEAVIHVVYDGQGNLIRKNLTKPSGDRVFDRSVEDTVLKSKKLPNAPGQRMEFDIIFNLKDLLEKG